MGGPALTRPAPILYHGLQPLVKPREAGAPRLTRLGRQGRPRLRTKAILLDRDRGNDAGMSRSAPRAGRTRVANRQEEAPKTALRPQSHERGWPAMPRPQRAIEFVRQGSPAPPAWRPAVHRPERLRAHPQSSQRVRRMRAHGHGQAGQQEVSSEEGDRRHRLPGDGAEGRKLEVKTMRKAHRSGASC